MTSNDVSLVGEPRALSVLRVRSRRLNVHQGIGSAVSFLAHALGFASNLSHTIRVQREDDKHSLHSDDSSTDISITDEELALLGPPTRPSCHSASAELMYVPSHHRWDISASEHTMTSLPAETQDMRLEVCHGSCPRSGVIFIISSCTPTPDHLIQSAHRDHGGVCAMM